MSVILNGVIFVFSTLAVLNILFPG
jgi:hypothetical protein